MTEQLLPLIKNSRLYARMKDAGDKHAFLLTGEDSEALKLTALLYAGGGQISATNPDIRLLPEEDGKYNKALMDGFFARLHYTPVAAEFVYYILHNAHDISERWQNALLKTLEEPPASVRFILTASSRSRLLPTVVSRCLCLEGDVFGAEELYAALQYRLISGKAGLAVTDVAIKAAAMAADGKLTEALRAIESSAAAKILDITIDTLLNLSSSAKLAEYTHNLVVYADETPAVLNQFGAAVRDAMRAASGAEELIGLKYKTQEIKQIADKIPLAACLKIIDAVEHARYRHKLYGNATGIIEELLMKVVEAKAGL